MQKFEIKDHEPSLLPEGNWKLAWADEFDGTELDRSKWGFRTNFWGNLCDAYTDEGVILDGNSCVELHRVEKDGKYVSPQLQTGSNSFDIPIGDIKNAWGEDPFWKLGELEPPKFVHRYGYYECRCKFQREPEIMWSAFWTQSPSIGTRFEPEWCGVESDIMECFEDGYITCGNIFGGYGKQLREDGRVRDIPLEKTDDGFHRLGMLWTPEEYVFYLDGKEISRCSEHISHVPQFILITTEVQGYRKRMSCDDINELPFNIKGEFKDDAFIVDYVRVFDNIDDGE